MEEGKCVVKSGCMFQFNPLNAECYLSFGVGTKFDFKYVSTDKVRLERKNIELIIPQESFIKLFKIC